MFTADENGVFATIKASPVRRVFAYGVLFALGGLSIYAPLASPPSAFFTVLLLTFGVLALLLAERLRRATRVAIELTETEVRDSNGTTLAHMDDIRQVVRGTFGFKPSNGFTLVLNKRGPLTWAPGLWWRIGRRIGIGGVTSAASAKYMAEQIAFRIKQREMAG